MSITTVDAVGEASTSKVGSEGQKDGEREETKEERRARKAAKRAVKAAQPSASTEESTAVAPEAGPSTAPIPAAPITEGSSGVEKKAKKDKKRKRAEEELNVAGPSTAVATDAAPQPGVEAVHPLDEKRARKAARKAAKAAARSAAVGGPPPPQADPEAAVAPTISVAAETPESTLSEPARKALEYVKSHAATHLSDGLPPPAGQLWKFNKANQNWLIRNVWNESEVPEEHVDGVMRYLNTIKGGGRKALIEMAEKASAAATAEAADTPVTTDPVAATPADPASTADPTAAVSSTTAPTPVISPEEAKRDREVIKARAEKLLVLLRA